MPVSADDVVSLVYFARVVEARSFTAAAAKLGVSKSAVSTRVAQLEEQFKVRLLNRTTRKLSLTPEGLAVFEQSAKLLAAAEDTLSAVAGAGDEPSGVLRIDAPTAFAELYLAAPLAAYLERFASMRVELSSSDRQTDLVATGVDVALRITPKLADSSLVARKIGEDRTLLCASPSYLKQHGVPAEPLQLLQHACVIYSMTKVADEWRFREPGQKELVPVPIQGRLAVQSGTMLRQAVLAGMGLGVLPHFMVCNDLRQGLLLPVLEPFFEGVALGIYAVYPQVRRPAPKVRALVELLQAHFKTPPWKRSAR